MTPELTSATERALIDIDRTASADGYFARNAGILKAKMHELREDRSWAVRDGNAAMVEAIDVTLNYYRAAHANNHGAPFEGPSA